MNSQRTFISILTISCILLLTTPLSADIVNTITFDTQPIVGCGETWIEDGIECMITTTTAEDCDGGGGCWFDFGDPMNPGVFMAPARLVVNLGNEYLLYRIEIDVIDYCGIGCTMSFAYGGGAMVGFDNNDFVSSPEVLVMDFGVSGAMVGSIAVSTCEGHVLGNTIRIYSEVVPTRDETWGAVKTLYR